MDSDLSNRSPAGPSVASTAPSLLHPGTPNPFVSPSGSRPSTPGSSNEKSRVPQRYFHSRRVPKGEAERPWLGKQHPREKWVTLLPIFGIVFGLAVSGFLVWDGIRSVVKHKYCPRLDTDFSEGFDDTIWSREVEMGGFGNGELAMSTSSDKNVLVENGKLVIRATPQEESLVDTNTLIDLLHSDDDISRWGACTSSAYYSCVAATNTTAGNSSIVPPAVSGRINTRNARDGLGAIKYGRVEVTARMPAGDWLWPAIWMMPVEDTYGPWPNSGEIDIAESRGNDHWYEQGGNNVVSSALHWGPDSVNDGWWRTNNKRATPRATYSDNFYTFGLEWSQKYIFTYVNSRLLQVLYTNFDSPLWGRGRFAEKSANGTKLRDPWGFTGQPNTPFDQPFYLILNVAVGGRNGWFEDGKSKKPWVDASTNAKKDFWQRRDEWLPTWTRPQMEVSRVQIWQQCDGNEDL